MATLDENHPVIHDTEFSYVNMRQIFETVEQGINEIWDKRHSQRILTSKIALNPAFLDDTFCEQWPSSETILDQIGAMYDINEQQCY